MSTVSLCVLECYPAVLVRTGTILQIAHDRERGGVRGGGGRRG